MRISIIVLVVLVLSLMGLEVSVNQSAITAQASVAIKNLPQ